MTPFFKTNKKKSSDILSTTSKIVPSAAASRTVLRHLYPFSKRGYDNMMTVVNSVLETDSKGDNNNIIKHFKYIPTIVIPQDWLKKIDAQSEIISFTEHLIQALDDFKNTISETSDIKNIDDLSKKLTRANKIQETEFQILKDFCDEKNIKSHLQINNNVDFNPEFNLDTYKKYRQKHSQMSDIKEHIDYMMHNWGTALCVTGTNCSKPSLSGHAYFMEFNKNDITFYNPGALGLIMDVTEKNDAEKTIGKSKLTYRFTLPLKENINSENIVADSPITIIATQTNDNPIQKYMSAPNFSHLNGNISKKLLTSLNKIYIPHDLANTIDVLKINSNTLNLKGFIPQYEYSSNCFARSPLLYAEDKMGTRLFTQFMGYIINSSENISDNRDKWNYLLDLNNIMTDEQKRAADKRYDSTEYHGVSMRTPQKNPKIFDTIVT